ncbi:Linear gramicidin synthase subunit D [Stieleria neptunia]|uniref:Linear gramicidin synthase subunit D n=1 Tax=Stieleria neptunia TaxID=2527979 RepID=A0A518I3H0_9BACT|nr:AMP-binding protein [Stieleria neptunia]QDV47616.1 Linear gramicidin synthase subunit D [Stieleria neptunia]
MTDSFWIEFDRVALGSATQIAIEEDHARRCSYRELQSMSCAVADLIHRSNVARQSVIAVGIEKSIEYVASLIGIWRAGCIALPLPEVIPAAVRNENGRRAGIAATLLADPSSTLRIQLQASCRQPIRQSSDLAYIFFTSGSTGAPKGVAVSHRGLVPVIKDQIQAFQLDRTTRSLFYLSICFDASLSDIGTALLSGGTLVIESDLQALPVEKLLQRIENRGITYADLPPAIVSRIGKQKCHLPESLSTVVVGGEVCSAEGIDWFSSRLDLFNVYGPTETTVCTSIRKCQPGELPTIGTPIAGMRYHVEPIDGDASKGSSVTVGGGVTESLEGELWISGPGLASGYVDDPELTDRKFVTRGSTRWYRTGDRVRRDASGECVFVGRIDRQFKLLGKLVEPEEIRKRIVEHPAVAETAVIPLRDERGSVRAIAAMVSPSHPSGLSVTSLREHLQNTLPRWMVPTTIKVVDAIEKTATGKVDLDATWDRVNASATEMRSPPDDATAELLRSLWAEVLGHDRFGWDDPFDAVGGSSLASMELIAAAQAEGLSLNPASVQHQSLRECVHHCDSSSIATTARLDSIVQELSGAIPALPAVDPTKTCDRSILLTGATGFLGTWVLDALIRQSHGAKLNCLVRAGDAAQALQRINSARRTFLGIHAEPLCPDDVRPICGDLAAPQFGLSDGQWSRLADQVTDLVHLAARVHLLDDFQTLRSVNLDPLVTLARLASWRRPKAVHYASTLSVFVATDRQEACYHERDRLETSTCVYGGYGQTKWAAEKLWWSIAGQQTPSIYRLGLLTGDTRRGVGPQHDQLAMLTRGISALGQYPDGIEDLCFDATPVDQAARGLVRLILDHHTGAFHLCGPESVSASRWFAAMQRVGTELTPVSIEHFRCSAQRYQRDQANAAVDRRDVAAACLALDYRAMAANNSRAMDLFLATKTRFDATRANSVLQPGGEQIRSVADRQLETMARVMLESVPERAQG